MQNVTDEHFSQEAQRETMRVRLKAGSYLNMIRGIHPESVEPESQKIIIMVYGEYESFAPSELAQAIKELHPEQQDNQGLCEQFRPAIRWVGAGVNLPDEIAKTIQIITCATEILQQAS